MTLGDTFEITTGVLIRRLHASVTNENSRCILNALSTDAAKVPASMFGAIIAACLQGHAMLCWLRKATCLNGFQLDQLLEEMALAYSYASFQTSWQDSRPCGRELLEDGLELKHRDHLKFGWTPRCLKQGVQVSDSYKHEDATKSCRMIVAEEPSLDVSLAAGPVRTSTRNSSDAQLLSS